MDLPDRHSWLALLHRPSEWEHTFGPPSSPVVIAGSSAEIRGLVAAMRDLAANGARRCLIVEGEDGSGKSLAAVAYQAACQARSVNVVFAHDGYVPPRASAPVQPGDALIVDNLDRLSVGVRRALFASRHQASNGTLLTVRRLSAIERELLGPDDDRRSIGRWEERPLDVLIVATLAWRELGLTPDLPELCADGVPEALSRWPWHSGAHGVRRFVTLLADALAVEGYFERSPRPIDVSDVHAALAAVTREERPVERDDLVRIVVEGQTDAKYLEAAAKLALSAWGSDLLSGCRVTPPGHDREGGAERAAAEIIALDRQGVTTIGLFDYDGPGRAAAKDVRKYAKLSKVHELPAEFDPLKGSKSAEVEIEDLLPATLVERFYEVHPELQPEERTSRGKLSRIVVAGADKDRVAEWICEHASFEEMCKLVYVLCLLRQSIGLPLPRACPALPKWLRDLGAD